VRAEAGGIPFRDDSFDLVTCLDLLEHIEDDEGALKEAFRSLKPGGLLLVTVPSYPLLFGAHDRAMGHLRRYRKAELKETAERAGFKALKASYYMSLVFPFTLVMKIYQKRFGSDTETIPYRVHPVLNGIFLFLCELESRMLVYMNMPAGSSIFLILKKPVSGVS
jgi:ubiquinone/menaquinone biosynthesis C-methylase UbiE